MPRLTRSLPRYRLHKASGQAIVEFAGQVHYLGPHGSDVSRDQYDALISQWLSAGRPLPCESDSSGTTHPLPDPVGEIKIRELVARFWIHAESHYVKYGSPTGTHKNYRPALRRLLKHHAEMPVSQFGPKALKRLKEEMRLAGNSRRYINDNLDRIRRVFTWGVSEELIPVEVCQRLATVESVRIGAAGVTEHAAVLPVSDLQFAQTLPFLPPVVQDMVQLQKLSGARPGELCILRPRDIDTSLTPWVYRPQFHKTEHHGKPRLIHFGPQAQAILISYLQRDMDAYCFSPQESEQRRSVLRRAKRKTKVTPSQAARKPKTSSRWRPKLRYTTESYRRSIARACDSAFPAPKEISETERKAWQSAHRWSPNQLRHAAATEICRKFGSLVAAKEALGHSSIRTTENYVQPKYEQVRDVMSQIG